MIQLIAGEKGKGKTKILLENVNGIVDKANGNIVYLDKNNKHIYDLNNKVRLIDLSEYDIFDSSEFFGFLTGIISQDHDLERVYFDSFLQIAQVKENDGDDLKRALERLKKISDKFNISFVVSISRDKENIPAIEGIEILTAL